MVLVRLSTPLLLTLSTTSEAYDVEHPEDGVAFRGSFLIDEEGMVRHQVINDLPLGRNVDEMPHG